MDWADPCNGVVVGSNGTIIKTSDGGKTWTNNSNPVFDAAQISIGSVVYHNVNSMFFSAGKTIYKSPTGQPMMHCCRSNPNQEDLIPLLWLTEYRLCVGYRFSRVPDCNIPFGQR